MGIGPEREYRVEQRRHCKTRNDGQDTENGICLDVFFRRVFRFVGFVQIRQKDPALAAIGLRGLVGVSTFRTKHTAPSLFYLSPLQLLLDQFKLAASLP